MTIRRSVVMMFRKIFLAVAVFNGAALTLHAAPADLARWPKEPISLRTVVERNQIVVHVGGQRKIVWHDLFLPLEKGKVGIGVSSGAKATFTEVDVKEFTPTSPLIEHPPHRPNFSVRKFLGGRTWVFDGDEPILQLHYQKDPSCFA